MKAKRRYVAQNVFHARTLPGLGNARITRLAAPGDVIPPAASRQAYPPHRLSAPRHPLAGRAATCQLAALDGHAGLRARTPGSRRAWPSRRIRLPGQAPPRKRTVVHSPLRGQPIPVVLERVARHGHRGALGRAQHVACARISDLAGKRSRRLYPSRCARAPRP